MKKRDIKSLIWGSLLLICFLTLLLVSKFKDDNILGSLGTTGDFIGGFLGTIVSIFATYLIFITYSNQKKELKLQGQLFAQQQFETTFFNMLDLHRNIKNNLSITSKDLITRPFIIGYTDFTRTIEVNSGRVENFDTISGKLVFDKLIEDFERLHKHFPHANPKYLISKEIDDILTENGYGLFGVNNIAENNNSTSSQFRNLIFKYNIFHSQHFKLLGDYFRNIYHILKFLSDKKKEFRKKNIQLDIKEYADIFQSQMSYMELALIFYNGLIFRKSRKLIKEFNFIENVHKSNLLINDVKLTSFGKIKS